MDFEKGTGPDHKIQQNLSIGVVHRLIAKRLTVFGVFPLWLDQDEKDLNCPVKR